MLFRSQLKQQKAQQAAEHGISDDARQLLKQRIGEVKQLDDALQAEAERKLERLIEQANDQKTTLSNTANGIMVSFRSKDKWAHIPLQREWATGLAALEDYVAYLQELQQEGLPNLVEQFHLRFGERIDTLVGLDRQILDLTPSFLVVKEGCLRLLRTHEGEQQGQARCFPETARRHLRTRRCRACRRGGFLPTRHRRRLHSSAFPRRG